MSTKESLLSLTALRKLFYAVRVLPHILAKNCERMRAIKGKERVSLDERSEERRKLNGPFLPPHLPLYVYGSSAVRVSRSDQNGILMRQLELWVRDGPVWKVAAASATPILVTSLTK